MFTAKSEGSRCGQIDDRSIRQIGLAVNGDRCQTGWSRLYRECVAGWPRSSVVLTAEVAVLCAALPPPPRPAALEAHTSATGARTTPTILPTTR